jgi:DNA-directed RNA polymerase specialized sigma subunit
MLHDKNLLGEVDGLLEALDPREKKIISQRFGLDGGQPKTLEDVGKSFGITRERIRQLQNAGESRSETEPELLNDAIFGAIYYRMLLHSAH